MILASGDLEISNTIAAFADENVHGIYVSISEGYVAVIKNSEGNGNINSDVNANAGTVTLININAFANVVIGPGATGAADGTNYIGAGRPRS
jgi:hypothetical protein